MSEVIDNPDLPTVPPVASQDTSVFWEATKEGRLLLTRCRSCDESIWYPRPICPFCHSTDTEWIPASGRGHIYTFTVVRRAGGQWGDATPYVVAYVELDEGPRMMTNIVDCDAELIEIGQSVEVVFHRSSEGSALPRFRPISS